MTETERMQTAMARVLGVHFWKRNTPVHTCACGEACTDAKSSGARALWMRNHVSAELMRMLHDDFGLREDVVDEPPFEGSRLVTRYRRPANYPNKEA